MSHPSTFRFADVDEISGYWNFSIRSRLSSSVANDGLSCPSRESGGDGNEFCSIAPPSAVGHVVYLSVILRFDVAALMFARQCPDEELAPGEIRGRAPDPIYRPDAQAYPA